MTSNHLFLFDLHDEAEPSGSAFFMAHGAALKRPRIFVRAPHIRNGRAAP